MKSTKNLWAFILVSIFLVSMLFLSILSALPTTPFTPSQEKKIYFSQILPQGWGFFSKNPRDEYIKVFDKNEEPTVSWPNMRVSNLFGIDRKGRGQGTELALILNDIPQKNFKACDTTVKLCIEDIKMQKSERIMNRTPEPTLCGEQFISINTPIPWAWSKSTDSKTQKVKIAKVNLVCSD